MNRILRFATALSLALTLGVSAETKRVSCVGDSITAGVGASKGNAYPSQLERMLGEGWSVKNFGVSGSTLLNKGDKPYQKTDKFKGALASEPDIVVIKLGTNDTKPQNWKFKDEFVGDYKSLIAQFAALPTHPKIFVCTPAVVPGKGNFGINEEGVIEQKPMLEAIAKDSNATIIDIHAALEPHPALLPDRVHPNTEGATIMARTVFKAITGKDFTGASSVAEVPKAEAKK